MKTWLRLASAVDSVSERSGRAVSWLMVVMVLLGAYNAVSRFLSRSLGSNLTSNGLLEAQWYLFSIVFLLGAGYTLKRDEHVRIDVFYSRFSPRTKALVDVLGSAALLLPFSVFAIVYAWPGVIESWAIREGSPDPGGLPRYPLKTLVPVAFALLAAQGVSQIVKRIASLENAKNGAEAIGEDSPSARDESG